MRKPFLREVATVDAAPDLDAEIEKLEARITGLWQAKSEELKEILQLEEAGVKPEPPSARGLPAPEQQARDLLVGIVAAAVADPSPERLFTLHVRQYRVLPRAVQLAQHRLAALFGERAAKEIADRGDEIRAGIRQRVTALLELRRSNISWMKLVDDLESRAPGARALVPLDYTSGVVFDDGSNDDDEVSRFMRAAVAAGICTPSEVRL
jgi:hypothetical protein